MAYPPSPQPAPATELEQELEERLRLALSGARAGAWQWDLVNDQVVWSPEIYDLYGVPRGSIAPSYGAFAELLHPEDRVRVADEFAAIAARGGPIEMEFRLLRPDGTEVWLSSVGRVEHDAEGRPVFALGINQDVTARRRAEAQREEARRTMQLALEVAKAGVWEWDVGADRVTGDENLARLFSLPAADVAEGRLPAEAFFRVIHPEDRPEVDRRLREVFAAGGEYQVDYRLAPAEGPARWLASRGRVELGPGGRPQRLNGLVFDITQQKQVELDAGFLADLNELIRTGDDPEGLLRTVAESVGRYLELDGVRALAAVPLMRDGRWVSPLAVYEGAPRPWTARETSLLETAAERTWNAVEKLRLHARLRDTQARLEATLAASEIATWTWDVPNDRVVADANLARIFSVSPEEAAGGPIASYLRAMAPEDRDRVRELIEGALRDGAGQYETDYRLVQADGSIRWVTARGRIERDAEGRPLRFPGVVIDITGRKEAEEALRQADRRKDEFLAMLAHELRNPLAPIRNAAQVLKLVGPGDGRQQWAREVIERQSQHLTRLVDDLLDVSRITQGKVKIAREPLDLAAVVHRAVEAGRPLIDARHHRLTVELPSEPVRLAGDLTRLVQVVGNLLNNAAKYTDEGGDIRVEAAREGEEAVIRVRDDGMGLPPDLLPHVFDLFTQADRSLDRSQGGLGIGLTLVRQLVELHGGRVEARSEGFGRGSEFTVRLPAEAPPERAAEEAADRCAGGARAMRILLVEDNADSAEMMSFLLTLGGHEVRTAPDGPAALEAARAFAPQAVLCDIGLPGMNGYEVAARLREQPAFRRTPLIALTGYGQEEARRRSREAGFDYHLVKPVEPEALDALLDSLRSEERT